MFWTAAFKREQILDLVKGEGITPQKIGIGGLEGINASDQELIGLWRSERRGELSPLPQLILGQRSALEDLIAWTAAYIPGLSPLSSMARLMTPMMFHERRNRRAIRDWRRFSGVAVGLMYGEVISYSRSPINLRSIDFEMCRSTLSYVLMRSVILGDEDDDISRIMDEWIRLRQGSGLATRRSSCDLLFGIVTDLIRAEGDRGILGKGFATDSQRNAVLAAQMRRVFENRSPRHLIVFLDDIDLLTAEEKVRIFDDIAMDVSQNLTYQQRDRGEILALLASWCRKGFANQLAMLEPFRAMSPECTIWLGALQALEPMSEALFAGGAVGWKLGSELFDQVDLYAAPDVDGSSFELGIVAGEGTWRDAIRPSSGTRVKVELSPGVTTLLKLDGRSALGRRESPSDGDEARIDPHDRKGTEELRSLHKSLRILTDEIQRYLLGSK